MQRNDLLAWIDLEMTGLNVLEDRLLEISVVLTNTDLHIVAEGPNLVIHQDPEFLDALPARQRAWLEQYDLIRASKESTTTKDEAEEAVLHFLEGYLAPQTTPLCGNSIGMDRRFLALHMPSIEEYLHYRSIDVSSIKELARRWHPEVVKEVECIKTGAHRARDDILESIAELKLYKERFFK